MWNIVCNWYYLVKGDVNFRVFLNLGYFVLDIDF